MQNIKKQIIVSNSKQLSCNGSILVKDLSLQRFSLHPKIYLDFKNNKVATCHYCKTEYILI